MKDYCNKYEVKIQWYIMTSKENNNQTEKIGYISEEEVNMRKGAGTNYSIIKTLK